MQRKFALLIVGALLALVIPASAMAAIYPAEHKFEIAPGVSETKPTLGTSLGSCTLAKISGTIPKAPANETSFEIPTPTAGTCTAGTTIALSGKWFAHGANYILNLLGSGTEPVVLRFSSLPNCKLKGGSSLMGVFSNGVTSPSLLKSGYHAHSSRTWTWDNDGGSCALAGKTETVSYSSESGGLPVSNPVTDTTSPATPIIVR